MLIFGTVLSIVIIFEPGNEMYGHYFCLRCTYVRTYVRTYVLYVLWKKIKLLRFDMVMHDDG